MSKPTSLVIHAEYIPWRFPTLIGVDPAGNRWVIGWCGNGAYSHWVLSPPGDPDQGYYHFVYAGPEYEREQKQSLLEKQIREAERKYRIYS